MTNTIVILPLLLLLLTRTRSSHHQSDASTLRVPAPLMGRGVKVKSFRLDPAGCVGYNPNQSITELKSSRTTPAVFGREVYEPVIRVDGP